MKTLVIGKGLSAVPLANLLLTKGEVCDVFVGDDHYDADEVRSMQIGRAHV